MDELAEPTVSSLQTQVNEQAVELAELRRALVSLGSHIAAGGLPGLKPYLAWHDGEIAKLPKPPSEAELRVARLEAELNAAREAAAPTLEAAGS